MVSEPATVHPGDSITVQSADSCKVKIPIDGWVAVAGHVGAGKALAKVKRSAEFNVSFRVEFTLPSNFPARERDDERAAYGSARERPI